MKKEILFCLCLFFPLFIAQAQHQVVSLDGDWSFHLDADRVGEQSSWYKSLPEDARIVSVPHTWNVEDGTERYFNLAWYQKEVQIPSEWKGRQIRLHFEAVYRDVVVYINGKKIGENSGSGYTPFSFEISKSLIFGEENRIVVSVSNAFSEHAFPYLAKFDWNSDGGIIRPVSLVITGKPSVRYAHVKPETNFNDHSATATIKIKTWEKEVKKAQFTLTFAEYQSKKVILSKTVELNVENDVFTTQVDFQEIKPWHFDSPNLYTLQIDISEKGKITDTYQTRFGFRKVEIKGHQFFLNEEPVRLAGIEYMPGSYPDYGMAEPEKIMSIAVDQMKDLNCVITRFHWQQDPRILDMLDERGMLAQEEIPWWQKPDNLTPEMEVLAKKQIDLMIERDFNHPSIFSWGVSNEVYDNTERDNYTQLIEQARSWDTNAFVAVISNKIADALADDVALLADIPTWNDYVGSWHAKVNEDAPGILKAIHEEALKGRPLLITEHGLCEPVNAGGDTRRIVDMAYHYNLWSKNDFVFGCIYFCLNDYRTHFGESGEGRYQQRVHGLTDQWFEKKSSYSVYKGLASPIYFEWVQPSAKGTEAKLSIIVKNSLPSYCLKNYKLVWRTTSGNSKELVLPDLKPGDKYETIITDLSPKTKPSVQVIRPTGYIVGEY
jgi:beta-glucuronidase